jgi:hypothetical protein
MILPLDEILHAILPEELLDGSPTGFAMVGHLGRPHPPRRPLSSGLTIILCSSHEPQR